MRLRLMQESDADDPVLSLVNLIDVFLVLIAALLLAVANNPLNVFAQDTLTIIRNPGKADMEIVLKDGQKIERFKGGGMGDGVGVKAGVAYRMKDGSIVYVPE